MAITIGGRKISVGVASKHTTLPIAGMYLAKTKAGNAYTLYIDHYTTAAKEHRSYKQVSLVTKDHSSLFCRLCAAFKVALPANVTQKAAAELLAASVAKHGALRCIRSGKKHDWLEIQPVYVDGEALPWGHKKLDGMVLQSLWNPPEDSEDECEEEGYYSIVGKTFSDVAAEIRGMGGIRTATLAGALGRVDAMDEGVDVECHAKLRELLATAVKMGLDVIELKSKEEDHVQA